MLATPTRKLRLMSTVWTREQEGELAELFQRYKGEQGQRGRGRREGGGGGSEIGLTRSFSLQT